MDDKGFAVVTTLQPMDPISALDISRIKSTRISPMVTAHLCPWCGSPAWSGRFHTQCLNEHCEVQAASPADLVAQSCDGDYDRAATVAETMLKRPGLLKPFVPLNKIRRRVMDFWLGCCRASRTMGEVQLTEQLRRANMLVKLSRYSRIPMNKERLALLLRLAKETGAITPSGLETGLPDVAMVSAVQSMPHTIDRLLVETARGTVHHIVWNSRRGGITGMIGLSYAQPRYLAVDRAAAAKLQFSLVAAGCGDEVASIFIDPDVETTEQKWHTETHMLTLAVEEDDDIIRAQEWLDCFPRIEPNVRAIWKSRIPGPSLRPIKEMPWAQLKCSSIDVAVGGARESLPTDAVRLIERTGARHADIERLIRYYESDGRRRIAAELRALADNRILEVDKRSTIREASNNYTIETPVGMQQIANFIVRLQSAVVFPEREATFFQCKIYCGKLVTDALIPADAVENVSSLQTAVRHQMLMRGTPQATQLTPTVVNSEAMRRYVLKHLRGQAASLSSQQGICRVGWSDDRATYYTPGAVVTLNGAAMAPTPLHPQVTTLRCFAPVEVWSHTCPDDLHPSCRDIIAMLLAMTVRSYKRYLPRPAVVAQSSDAVDLLKGLLKAVGQTSVFELSHNVRDSGNIDGVKGYPFVASGYGKGQISSARVPYMLMAEEGYHVATHVDTNQIEDAGRALQFGLLRVVEWCLATGADDFTESASMDYNTSLMREGRWLMRNVCELQSWEVSARGADKIEELFAQIPVADTVNRLTLVDGITLTADIRGLQWDSGELSAELTKIEATLDVEAQLITASGASLLPSLSKFYGCEPGMKTVLTDLD